MRGKRLTVAQKRILQSHGITNVNDYLCVKTENRPHIKYMDGRNTVLKVLVVLNRTTNMLEEYPVDNN